MRSPRPILAVAVMLATALATLAAPGHADPGHADPGPDDRLRQAAAANDMSVSEVRRILEDPSARLSGSGRIYYADPARPSGTPALGVEELQTPLSKSFTLHSNPGSNRVMFLDFDGHAVSGSQWNTDGLQSRTYEGWDPAGNGPSFSAAELSRVQSVWARVAEDYAPFNIDVTTEDPGNAAIDRSGDGDQFFGTRALFTDDAHAHQATCDAECAGVAFLDVFDDPANHARYQPAFIFPGSQGNKALAETTSHEVGHNFGLEHDGKGGDAYYVGHGSWAPVMGFSDFEPISTWSDGAYGGTSDQDDVELINGNGAPFRPDEAPSSVGGAPPTPSGTAFITKRSDKDVYSLGQCTGTLGVTAQPAGVSPNLDIELRLLDSDGSTLTTANPLSAKVDDDVASGLDASINQAVSSGTYYVQVDGVGRGAPATSYDDYGSLGAYTLQVTGCTGGEPGGDEAPSAPQDLTGSYLGDGAVMLQWSPPANDGGVAVSGYNVYVDGEFIGDVAGNPGGVTVNNVPSGTHTFGVAAVNSVGVGPQAQVTVDATDESDEARPGKPVIGKAKPGSPGGVRSVKVGWKPPTSVANPAIDGYQVVVYKRNNRGKYVKYDTSGRFPASARGAVLKKARGSFKFAVRAHNSLGYGALSAKSNAATAR